MIYDVFPIESLWPDSCRWRLINSAFSGGITESQDQRLAVTSGGGKWVCDMSIPLIGINGLTNARAVKLARAFVLGCDGGATPVIVPYFNQAEAPWPLGVPPGTVPFSDDATFSDGSEFQSGAISITASAAALRATSLTIDIGVSGELEGGEMYSINHPVRGKHLYAIIRINGNVISARPPAREAIDDDTALNFDTPGCVMILTNADDAMEAITPPYQSRLNLSFREY